MRRSIHFILILIITSNLFGSDFGTTGLIDLPNARMMNDGDLKITFSTQKTVNNTNISYQVTPWLQSTFRYSIFNPDNPVRATIDNVIDGLNDRSYSIKATLLNENKYIPELALGIKDIMGTGAWSSEYIVASKKINNFDITLGLGWGRLAERDSFDNPLIKLSKSFTKRKYGGGAQGGKINSSSFFKGDKVGLFSGVSYKIPNSNLSVVAEYNSDSYQREIEYKTITDTAPLSYGLKWNGLNNIDLNLSYKQGNQLGFSFSSKINTSAESPKYKDNNFFSAYDGYLISAAPASLNLDSWYDSLFYDLERSGILLRKAKIDKKRNIVTIEISNFKYNIIADAINRVINLSQIHLPQRVSRLNIIVNEDGHLASAISFRRAMISGNFRSNMNDDEIDIIKPYPILNPNNLTVMKLPRGLVRANLAAKFQLFDPDMPLKHQVYLKFDSTLNLPMGWNLFGTYAVDIENNFDTVRGPNSYLPHVRTEINNYLVEGSSGIDSLYFEKKSTFNQHLHYRFYIGILETMYSGAGIELLYQPYLSRLAFGATLNKVRRRGFKRDFELLDYEVSSNFLSIFYATPFHNYDIALHIGKYLAKDKGVTFDIRRTFDNGFSVGAFASLTDVPAELFGEGSFDKGLYFKIPFDIIFGRNTKSSFSTIIRSVQRDGGQKLDDFSGRLWYDLRDVRHDNLLNNKPRMLNHE